MKHGTIMPLWWIPQDKHVLIAEATIDGHQLVAEVPLPAFVAPGSEYWESGIRIAKVKAGRALAAMWNEIIIRDLNEGVTQALLGGR